MKVIKKELVNDDEVLLNVALQGSKKRFLKPNPVGFWGFYWFFLDKQERNR